MSGGSHDYAYSKVDREYVGHMHDPELDEMIEGLVKVLHDVEWWQSGDIGEEAYRETTKEFKDKWLGKRDSGLRKRIKSHLENVQKLVLET